MSNLGRWLGISLPLVTCGLLAGCSGEDLPVKHWVYFGTGANSIYVSEFGTDSGELGSPRPVAEIERPGFLAVHPNGEVLYAVGRESDDGAPPRGIAAAYAIDRLTGDLREISRAPTAGRGAAHVAVNALATALAAVNYGDGNTVTVSLQPDGRLDALVSDISHEGSSVHPQRQTEPHPHSANFTPDGRFVIVPDLGTDELVRYAIDPDSGRLDLHPGEQFQMEPGSGPRHMTFHPNGRWAYVINELASTVAVLNYESDSGLFTPVQTASTLAEGFDGRGARAPERTIPLRLESRRQHDRGLYHRRGERQGRADRDAIHAGRLAAQFPALA